MNKSILAVIAMAALACTSCKMNVLKGKGNKTTTNPTVSSFNAVSIEIPIKTEITIREGAPTVQLSGYQNILDHIKAAVENNKLVIHYDLDDTWTIHGDEMTAIITLPALTALSLTGAPDANIHGNITGGNFKLEISGASDVILDSVNADNFTADVSGAADIKINGGNVRTATYTISGAGDIKAYKLQTQETAASISGAGDGQVTALQKLTASISGAGEIKYKGHPTITKNISGVGELTDAN
jgi:hypothetical protein